MSVTAAFLECDTRSFSHGLVPRDTCCAGRIFKASQRGRSKLSFAEIEQST